MLIITPQVSFYFNYGNPDHMAVRQIRFVRARESIVLTCILYVWICKF